MRDNSKPLVLGAICLLMAGCAVAWMKFSTPASPTEIRLLAPSPALTPVQVVNAQLLAFKTNISAGDDPKTMDRGIRTAFEFASPGNREITGPADRFVQLVRTPAYLPLLNHQRHRVVSTTLSGDRLEHVVEIVDILGSKRLYVFLVSRQSQGKYDECWMIDGVTPIEDSDLLDGSIPA